jgi:hypothetical protein
MNADIPSQQHHDDPAAARTAAGAESKSALGARRWLLILSPALAGVLAIIGGVADPAELDAGAVGTAQAYADNPAPLQFKSFGLHWSYAFWILPAVLLPARIRGRGAWLANIAGVVGIIGLAAMPGLLWVDFFDSSVGQVAGAQTAVEAGTVMSGMWGAVTLRALGLLGFVLALPLAMAAGWRAGVTPWWGFVGAVLALLAFLAPFPELWLNAIVASLFLAVVTLAFARGTRRSRSA